jgi:hypothetical protein
VTWATGATPATSWPVTNKRFQIGMLISRQTSALDWLETLRAHCLGVFTQDGGKYQLQINKALPGGYVRQKYSEAHNWGGNNEAPNVIARSIRWGRKRRRELFNEIEIRFSDYNNAFAPGSIVKQRPNVAAGTEVARRAVYELPGVLDSAQAGVIGTIILNLEWDDAWFQWEADRTALKTLPWDVIALSGNGLSNQDVRVRSVTPTTRGTFLMRGSEYHDASNSATIQASDSPISTGNVGVAGGGVPGDVLGFFAVPNGLHVMLTWQRTNDPDVEYYEIRRGMTTDTWSTATFVGQSQALTYQDTLPYFAAQRYFVKAVAQRGSTLVYSTNATTVDVTLQALGGTATEASKSPDFSLSNPTRTRVAGSSCINAGLWYGTGNLIVEGTDRGAGPSSFAKLKIFLCRQTSPATAEAERSAGGYTVGGWATNVDDPRRRGAPLWAPLPNNATGEIYGQIDSGSQAIRRLGDHRARFFAVIHQGDDAPANVSTALPLFAPSASAAVLPYSKHYGVNYLRPARAFSAGSPLATAGVILYMGLVLSTNSTAYQQVISDDGSGNLFGISTDLKTYSFAKASATSDGSGLSVVSYADYANSQMGAQPIGTRWMTVQATVVVATAGKGVLSLTASTSRQERSLSRRTTWSLAQLLAA